MIKAKRKARHTNVLGSHEYETIKAKMQAHDANVLGTPEHEIINAKKQAHYANILGTPGNDKRKNASTLFKYYRLLSMKR